MEARPRSSDVARERGGGGRPGPRRGHGRLRPVPVAGEGKGTNAGENRRGWGPQRDLLPLPVPLAAELWEGAADKLSRAVLRRVKKRTGRTSVMEEIVRTLNELHGGGDPDAKRCEGLPSAPDRFWHWSISSGRSTSWEIVRRI